MRTISPPQDQVLIAQKPVRERGWRGDLNADWNPYWRGLTAGQRAALSPIVTACNREGIPPAHVYATTIKRIYQQGSRHIDSDTKRKHWRARMNSALKNWNVVSAAQDLRVLDTIPNERDAMRDEKQSWPQQILSEVDNYRLFMAESLSPETIVTQANRLLDIVVVAKSVGLTIKTFNDLADVHSLDVLCEASAYKSYDQACSRRNKSLQILERLLRCVLNNADGAARVAECRSLWKKNSLALRPDAIMRLVPFDDPSAMPCLLRTCDDAIVRLECRGSADDFPAAQAAVAIQIINNLPLGREELLQLVFEGDADYEREVLRPGLCGLVFGQRENLDEHLHHSVRRAIDRYWVVANRQNFPTKHLLALPSGNVKSGSALSVAIGKLAKKAGFKLTPQLLRDLAVKRLIEAENSGTSDSDANLKDVVGYSYTGNFTLRYAAFHKRVVAEARLQAAKAHKNDR